MLKSFVLTCLLFACTAALQPYCVHNETIRTLVPVQKTRQIKKNPSWKIWKKQGTQTEVYMDFEEHFEVKPITKCCSGYHMTDLQLCEPTCPLGCPTYARCEAPNRCHCMAGYITAISPDDGRPYCEPMCTDECPSGTICKEPNKCECKDGYHALDDGSGRCVPWCSSGDGCQHGRCVNVDECICDKGYTWHADSTRCLADGNAGLLTTTLASKKLIEQDTNDDAETDSDEDTTDYYQPRTYPKQNYYTTTTTTSTTTTTIAPILTECPEGYLLYRGECRVEDFSYDAASSTMAPTAPNCNGTFCGPNQICLPNGTCSCEKGFKSNNTNVLACLFANPLSDAAHTADRQPSTLGVIGFCVLGVCVAVLLTVLAVKLLRRRSGVLDVETTTKERMQCEFTNKVCDSEIWVP